MAIPRRGNSLLGLGNAPEPGFRPGMHRGGVGVRWGPAWLMLRERAARLGLRSGARFRPGARRGLARWGLGLANATSAWRLARSTFGSPMLGSVNAPELGFRPSTRRGPGMRWGPGARWRALAHAGALARVGGFGFPWRLTRSRLCLGWCCGLRVVAGLPACGAACGGECHVLLRSYVVGVHWMRAYACVALGEWRTDAASEEVYVGAGGGIASVA